MMDLIFYTYKKRIFFFLIMIFIPCQNHLELQIARE